MPRLLRCQVIFVINATKCSEARKKLERLFFPHLIFSGRVVCLAVCLSVCFGIRNYVLISFDLSFSHDVISFCFTIYSPQRRGLPSPPTLLFGPMKLRVSVPRDVWQTNVFLTHLFV